MHHGPRYAQGMDSAVPTIAFERAFNVRDLGGIPTADGSVVAAGRLFRADGVHRLAGDDLEVARGLGLRTVLDLRTRGEVESRGTFPAGDLRVAWHHLPLITRQWSEDSFERTDSVVEFLSERYVAMLDSGGASIARAVELVATGTPALFHCAAGKDRTGVLAAVLLGLVGVADEDIAADYHASAGAMARFQAWLQTEFPEAADAMTDQPPEYLECPPEAMLGFLSTVRARHGSMAGLASHLGISEEIVAALRPALVD